MGLPHRATLPVLSAPPEVASAWGVLHSLRVPATTIGFKDPGLWSLSFNPLYMILSDWAS